MAGDANEPARAAGPVWGNVLDRPPETGGFCAPTRSRATPYSNDGDLSNCQARVDTKDPKYQNRHSSLSSCTLLGPLPPT
eukprot:898337-Lingulodinium_polyedra.AAC.1